MARIESVGLLTGEGEPATSLPCGGPGVFEVRYRTADDRPLPNGIFEVRVKDRMGVHLFNLSTYLTGEHFESLPPAGTVFCRVPQMLLPADDYSIDTVLHVNNVLADEVERATSFTVADRDVFRSGRTPRRGRDGQFVMAHSWATTLRGQEPAGPYAV